MKKNLVSLSLFFILFALVIGPFFALEKLVHPHDSQETHSQKELNFQNGLNSEVTHSHNNSHSEDSNHSHQHLIIKSISPHFYYTSNNLEHSLISIHHKVLFYFLEVSRPSTYISDNLRPPIFS